MRTLNRPMFNMGGPIKQGVMHGIREPYRGGQLVRPGPGRQGYQGKAAVAKGIFSQIAKQWGKIKPTIPQIPGPKGTALVKYGENIGRSTPTVGMPFSGNKAKYLKSWAKENPYWTAGGAFYGAAPTYAVATGAGPPILKTIADFAVPDFIYNWETGRWFDPDDKNIKEVDKKAIVQGNVSKTGPATKDTITPAMREEKAKADKNKRVNDLLDMMGYDRSKKTAIADALIDASKIVSERGTLKGDVTRELINPIIQATSKRLDKPEQIREAVGLMMVKGEIEKDISKEKDALAKALTMKRIEQLDKALAGADFKEVITSRIIKGETASGSTLAQILRATEGIDAKVIPSKVVPKGKDALSVITEIVKKSHEEGKPYPPGNYVIKDRIIMIDAEGNIETYY